jgi:hypothetical protein
MMSMFWVAAGKELIPVGAPSGVDCAKEHAQQLF